MAPAQNLTIHLLSDSKTNNLCGDCHINCSLDTSTLLLQNTINNENDILP